MACYSLQIDCSNMDDFGARAWIDTREKLTLDTEFEVQLVVQRRADGIKLVGSFHLPELDTFYYRIGLVGPRSGEWELSIVRRESGATIHRDRDEFAAPKTWLMGQCFVDSGQGMGAEPPPQSRVEPRNGVVCLSSFRGYQVSTGD